MDIRKFGNNTNLISLWDGSIVYNESVLFLENADGTTPDAPLLYCPDEILQVCSSTCDVEYQEGVDYTLTDGKLRLLPNSKIPTLSHKIPYPTEKTEDVWSFDCKDGGLIAVLGNHILHKHQVFVSYRHHDRWNGFVQSDRTCMLPRTMQMLREGKKVNLMFFGDSITTPADVSGNALHDAPDMASWPELAFEVLHSRYPSLTYTNTAVGGMASPWGVEVVKEKFSNPVPDIAIIGFGMNDATGDSIQPLEFAGNICHIMERARTLNPNMEFILISTSVPNPMAPHFDKSQREHEPLFLQLEHPGVAVMRMTSVHDSLLTRKRFYDMSGNNINHPNDFLSRAYAQTLLRVFGID